MFHDVDFLKVYRRTLESGRLIISRRIDVPDQLLLAHPSYEAFSIQLYSALYSLKFFDLLHASNIFI